MKKHAQFAEPAHQPIADEPQDHHDDRNVAHPKNRQEDHVVAINELVVPRVRRFVRQHIEEPLSRPVTLGSANRCGRDLHLCASIDYAFSGLGLRGRQTSEHKYCRCGHGGDGRGSVRLKLLHCGSPRSAANL